MADILAIGEALVELNQPSDGAPFKPGFGGDTSNAMIAAARLGARAGYFTAVGADRFGESLVALWKSEGVDASGVVVNGAAHTGIYFVTHGSEGHAFSYMRAGSAASRLTDADTPAEAIRAARILHVSGVSQAISSSATDLVFSAIDVARQAGVLVSYDTNLRLKLWPLRRARAITNEALRSADVALPSLDDAIQLSGQSAPDAILDFYLGLGARVVALKLGKEGSAVATPERRERVAPYPVAAIDATGAGDAFDGAFLAEYLNNGGEPFAAARFANVSAALSTLGFGAVAPLPRRADVQAAIAKGR